MTVISVHSIIKHLSERDFIVIHCQIPGLDYIFLSSFLRFLLFSKHYTWEYEDFDGNYLLLMKIFDQICIRAIIRNLGGICPEVWIHSYNWIWIQCELKSFKLMFFPLDFCNFWGRCDQLSRSRAVKHFIRLERTESLDVWRRLSHKKTPKHSHAVVYKYI